jgi:hypothetical protein
VVALPWATSLVEFRILGPFEVLEHDRPLVVGGPKVRALLAVLLLHRGEVVSTDRLIDALWAERATARASLPIDWRSSSAAANTANVPTMERPSTGA